MAPLFLGAVGRRYLGGMGERNQEPIFQISKRPQVLNQHLFSISLCLFSGPISNKYENSSL